MPNRTESMTANSATAINWNTINPEPYYYQGLVVTNVELSHVELYEFTLTIIEDEISDSRPRLSHEIVVPHDALIYSDKEDSLADYYTSGHYKMYIANLHRQAEVITEQTALIQQKIKDAVLEAQSKIMGELSDTEKAALHKHEAIETELALGITKMKDSHLLLWDGDDKTKTSPDGVLQVRVTDSPKIVDENKALVWAAQYSPVMIKQVIDAKLMKALIKSGQEIDGVEIQSKKTGVLIEKKLMAEFPNPNGSD